MTPRAVNRGWVGTVLVVLLVVLAGCTGGGGAGAGEGGGEGADGGAAGSSGSSSSGGSGGSSGSSGSGGSGSSGGGSGGDGSATPEGDDSAELKDSYDEYASNLRELGSYTATYTWSAEGNDTNSSFQGIVRTDLEAETAYMVQTILDDSGETTTVELYWPEGEDSVYTRYDTGESSFYQKAPREQSMLTLWTDPILGSGNVPSSGANPGSGSLGGYSYEGVVSTAEGPRHKYVIDDLTAASVEGTSQGEVTEYYSEILVDEQRGLITDYRIQVTYSETSQAGLRSFSFELTYRDIGSTTVPEPEWLTEAEAQAG